MSVDEKVSIKGLDRVDVLCALYDRARPQGLGFLHYTPAPMSREEAAKELERSPSFDYLKGRAMKVNLKGDEFSPWGYDRDNGEGAAAEVIAKLREKVATPAKEQR